MRYPIRNTHPESAAGCQTNDLHDLTEPLGHTRERVNERGETRGFDFSWAGTLLAKVFADLDEQPKRLSSAGQIGHAACVAAMHPPSGASTQRTTGRYLRRYKGHCQHIISFLESHELESFG